MYTQEGLDGRTEFVVRSIVKTTKQVKKGHRVYFTVPAARNTLIIALTNVEALEMARELIAAVQSILEDSETI